MIARVRYKFIQRERKKPVPCRYRVQIESSSDSLDLRNGCPVTGWRLCDAFVPRCSSRYAGRNATTSLLTPVPPVPPLAGLSATFARSASGRASERVAIIRRQRYSRSDQVATRPLLTTFLNASNKIRGGICFNVAPSLSFRYLRWIHS